MALFHSHFFSEVLGIQTEATVILPQPASDLQIGVKTSEAQSQWPCLWLLHGMSDDHTIWLRRTSIERYADAAGVAVVMPNCHRSFYCDMKHGGDYWTFLSEELPSLMRSFFPLSSKRSDNAVAGLSIGGYGATRWLLSKPDAFIAGASLSGSLNLRDRLSDVLRDDPERLLAESIRLTFGEQGLAEKSQDVIHMVSKASKNPECPPLLQICGTEDFLYQDNLEFKKAAEACGYPLTYRERPGEHEWGFWDQAIQDVLDWLPEQGFGSS